MGLKSFIDISEQQKEKSKKVKRKRKKKSNLTHCKRCRKKVEAIEIEDNELVCPKCKKSLGFVSITSEPKSHFIEMVQNYIDFNKINAKAIIDEDDFLAVLINFETEDYTKLSDLLSKCMPISYVIVNTASSDFQDIEKSKPKPKIDEKPKPNEESKPKVDEKPKPNEKPKPKVDEKPKPIEKSKPNEESKPKPIEEPKPKPIEKPKPKPKPKKVIIGSYHITDLVIDYRAKKWCKYPYQPLKDKNGRLKRDRKGNIKYQYPNGCPNYNKSSSCPPKSLKIEDFIDITDNIWFLVAKFNLKNHFDEQRKKHPDWSDRQCRNPRHWQNSVASQLEKECIEFVKKTDQVYDLKPESLGVNVFKTLKNLDYILEKRPKNFVSKVAIIGTPKKKKQSSKSLSDYFKKNLDKRDK